ncbi:XRE family transcriptional regulator [Actinokineospora soli]|uniref:XRE family transcriptional regulator n=1 Tax=Actinokineospora soli TaxID=1048753 RepID=A0ABW2TR81_9PSEU
MSEDAGALAARVNHLFRTVRSPRGGVHLRRGRRGHQGQGGPTISATYLWQLRKGLRDNPTKRHLEALADFFGVPPGYFFDDAQADRIDAELALLNAFRDSPVRQIALRASGLSEQSLATIASMVERVRELEGLPEADGDR